MDYQIKDFGCVIDDGKIKFECVYCQNNNDTVEHTIVLIRDSNGSEDIQFIKNGRTMDFEYYFYEAPKVVKDFVEKIRFFGD